MKLKRREFLAGGVASAAAFLDACSSAPKKRPVARTPLRPGSGNNVARFFASSGFAPNPGRVDLAVARLTRAGFGINNQEVAFRRYQRFAGTERERAADFQDLVTGKAPMPKLLLGLRGGYGAMQILPLVNWPRLSAMMREKGTLLLGFSDVTAIQLALLAKGQMLSFCGPMVYSEFGNPEVSPYTMSSFAECVASPEVTINAAGSFLRSPLEGTLWGGNLSVLAALAGTPYMPQVDGGILFVEDTGEQPYRIERMLQTLYLAGILKRQKALILGQFKMAGIYDLYDSSYDLSAVTAAIRTVAKIPVLTNFPFGHIRDKATFPLGAHARLTPTGGGFNARFSGYPYLNARELNLASLLTPAYPEETEDSSSAFDTDEGEELEWVTP